MPYTDIEKRRENQREYYQRHRSERLAYRKSHRAIDRETWRRWAIANPEQRMAHLRKYKAEHPEYTRIYQGTKYRRTAKRGLLEICNCGEVVGLHVHHKDGDNHNGELANLEWLCPSCHSKVHANP